MLLSRRSKRRSGGQTPGVIADSCATQPADGTGWPGCYAMRLQIAATFTMSSTEQPRERSQ
jgi:hypothetical protein